ncbi:MAG: hypothetical protein AB3N64_12825 [Puniceicoccaceae bacterium]
MIIRKLGKFLRGKATPFQIISATVLGGLLGSLPGFGQGPLLLALLLFLLIILNANLFLGGLTLILVKLLSLALLPLYFNLGVSLLESGLAAPIAVFVNAPVTAWFGLDYYVMVPSLLVGGLAGFLFGIFISRSLSAFRSRMAGLETDSERYEAYTSKLWVRSLAWLFVGGLKGKKSWTALSEQKGGLPVRPLGIIFVVSLVVLGYVSLSLLDKTIVTSSVRDGMERANGATVDIASIEILPAENRVTVSGLAMANPDALDTNRFAAATIVADISGMSLLSKKVVIDSLQILEPTTGSARRVPGVIVVSPEEPEPVEVEEDVVSIDDYIGQASVWRERLRLLKRIYDRIAPHVKSDGEETVEDSGLSWREQLALRAKEEGYARVKSDSLVKQSPRLWIRELKSDNLVIADSGDSYRLGGTNLATQPALLEVAGKVEIAREDGDLDLTLELPYAAAPNRSGVSVNYRNLSIDEMEQQAGKDLPMNGGTMDIAGSGYINNGILDIPLKVTLNDTTLNAFGSSVPLDSFPVEVGLGGPIDRPTLKIPKDAIEKALLKGGQQQIENLIEEEAGKKLKDIFKLGG